MPDSPLKASEAPLSFDILINGQQINDIYQVISIEVEQAVFRIPTARIVLVLPAVDGSIEVTVPFRDAVDPGGASQFLPEQGAVGEDVVGVSGE